MPQLPWIHTWPEIPNSWKEYSVTVHIFFIRIIGVPPHFLSYCPTSTGHPYHLAGKSPVLSSFTRAYMASVPYCWIIHVAQLDVPDPLMAWFSSIYQHMLTVTNAPSSQGQLLTGTHCHLLPDLLHLSTPSATLYTEWCSLDTFPARRLSWHTGSKGCTPIAGLLLKNWRIVGSAPGYFPSAGLWVMVVVRIRLGV